MIFDGSVLTCFEFFRRFIAPHVLDINSREVSNPMFEQAGVRWVCGEFYVMEFTRPLFSVKDWGTWLIEVVGTLIFRVLYLLPLGRVFC